jgi:hypothetical protein
LAAWLPSSLATGLVRRRSEITPTRAASSPLVGALVSMEYFVLSSPARSGQQGPSDRPPRGRTSVAVHEDRVVRGDEMSPNNGATGSGAPGSVRSP